MIKYKRKMVTRIKDGNRKSEKKVKEKDNENEIRKKRILEKVNICNG